jgi:tRNA A37 N6-isopentenylltransferase MiaA
MQVYRDLRVLTARPSETEERDAPHRLFGEIDGAQNFSVGLWLARARTILAENAGRSQPILFVGGAGLYFSALDEVAALLRRGLDPALPVMRAHGAPQPMAHLRGELSLAEAAGLAVRETRRYAKRQFTWTRHQMPDFAWIAPEAAEAAALSTLALS